MNKAQIYLFVYLYICIIAHYWPLSAGRARGHDHAFSLFNQDIGTSSRADKSAVGAINDSVGKFCKHVRTSPFSERRTEHYEKNLHMQRKRAAILAPPSCLMLLLFACRR